MKRNIEITSEADVSVAASLAAEMGEGAGLGRTKNYMLSTAVSELAMNIFLHAVKGEVILEEITKPDRKGIKVTARDIGPGIEDLSLAMSDNYSTGGGLGVGLSGSKRLMDEFSIDSEAGRGTEVVAVKWGDDLG